MNAEPNPTSAAECFRLISMGALPPATTIAAQGQPTWDLKTLVEFFQLPLDAVSAALAERARDGYAESARQRHGIPTPALGFESWNSRNKPTRKPLRQVPAYIKRELAGK